MERLLLYLVTKLRSKTLVSPQYLLIATTEKSSFHWRRLCFTVNSFGNSWLNVYIFKAKMLKLNWFQLFKCDYLILCFVMHISTLIRSLEHSKRALKRAVWNYTRYFLCFCYFTDKHEQLLLLLISHIAIYFHLFKSLLVHITGIYSILLSLRCFL